MNIIKNWQLIAFSLVMIFATSCKEDSTDDPTPKSGDKDVLVSTILPNPDGTSGSAFMQLIKNIKQAEYTNKQALEASYSLPPIVRGKDIYLLPGWAQTNNVLRKYTIENSVIISKGSVQLTANSGANALEVKGNKAYVSYSKIGKIAVIDIDKMQKITEIDISKYGIGDENPDPCQLVVRDNILYVALNQLVGGFTPDMKRPSVDILLIDTKTDKPIKMITEETAGMSMPTKPEADDRSMFIDEHNDIYINCISGFGMIGHKAGFLRIKAGETDFDKSYQFDITNTAIDGLEEKASYFTAIQYVGNGKLYATVTVPAYYSQPKPDYFKDRVIFPVEVNLQTKTAKRLGTQASSNFGAIVGMYKEKILFGLTTTTDNGFFVYDPTTKKMSEHAVIKIKGYPQSFVHIGEKW